MPARSLSAARLTSFSRISGPQAPARGAVSTGIEAVAPFQGGQPPGRNERCRRQQGSAACAVRSYHSDINGSLIDIRSRARGVLTIARSSEGAITCVAAVQLRTGPNAAGVSAEWKVAARKILS